jgi:hypothetical protein
MKTLNAYLPNLDGEVCFSDGWRHRESPGDCWLMKRSDNMIHQRSWQNDSDTKQREN